MEQLLLLKASSVGFLNHYPNPGMNKTYILEV